MSFCRIQVYVQNDMFSFFLFFYKFFIYLEDCIIVTMSKSVGRKYFKKIERVGWHGAVLKLANKFKMQWALRRYGFHYYQCNLPLWPNHQTVGVWVEGCCLTWLLTCRTSECSFQVGPILVVDEPFTVRLTWQKWMCLICNSGYIMLDFKYKSKTLLQIDSGLMTPTMKVRRDQVVAKYKEEIANLYK